MNNIELIAATEARAAMQGIANAREQFIAAAKVCAEHYLLIDRQQRFQVAIAVVIEAHGKDSITGKQLLLELELLNAISDPVRITDWNITQWDERKKACDFQPLGLVQLWLQVEGGVL